MIPKVILTRKGAAMLAKIPAGDPAPVTRWQIGTGVLPAGASLDRTELVEPLDYIPVSEITQKDNQATVLGQFTNQGRPAFAFEELGLYAADPDEGEILMCYGNAYGAGEQIQAGDEQLREFVFGTELLFSSTASVTAEIDQALVFIPKKEKGQPGGVATLDKNGKVPKSQLPDDIFVSAIFQVSYNEGDEN